MTSRHWFALCAFAVISAVGFGYCWMFYANGIDIAKDGGLITLLLGLASVAAKLIPTDSK